MSKTPKFEQIVEGGRFGVSQTGHKSGHEGEQLLGGQIFVMAK